MSFPIDAVVTWVDSTDPDWIQRKENTLQQTHTTNSRWTPANSKPDGELEQCLKYMKRNMPWIRKIFIVTQKQIPDCLTTETIVDHEEIGLDLVFNPFAIESSLHRIPGLSEHFLCFNDDFYVTRPLDRTAFFDNDGTMILRCDIFPNWYTSTKEYPECWLRTEKHYGAEFFFQLKHTPYAFTKSAVKDAENYDPIAWNIARMCRSRYTCNEINPFHAICTLALKNKKARIGHFGVISSFYEEIPSSADMSLLAWLLRFPHVVCINSIEGSRISDLEHLLYYKNYTFQTAAASSILSFLFITIIIVVVVHIVKSQREKM